MSIFTSRHGGSHSRGIFPEPSVPFPGASSSLWSAGNVTPSLAMQNDSVWACVSLISEAVGMMELETFRMGRGGEPEKVAPNELLKHPAADATLSEWVQMVLVSALLRGNTYGYAVRKDGYGYPLQVELFHPDEVSCRREDGRRVYRVKGVEIPRDDVFHMRGMRIAGQYRGLSPISHAARTLKIDDAAKAFGFGFFEDGAHPSSILSTQQQITKDQAETIKARFKSAIEGRDVAVLGAGVQFTPIQVSPEESQFLQTQKMTPAKIARIYKVPPELIGAEGGKGLTYSNVTQRYLDFLTFAVQPWLKRVEDAVSAMLPDRQFVRFNTSALVRMTPADRWKVDEGMLRMGAKTINEVRKAEGSAPVEWGDEPWLPSLNTSAAQTVQADEIDPGGKGDN